MTLKKKTESSASRGTQDHFGFQPVDEAERQGRVNTVFDSVANKYDLMNDAMSGGLQRLWKAHLINRLRPKPGMRLLDLAGGTGDVAFRFLDAVGEIMDGAAPVTVCDINPNMLEVGRGRALDKGYLTEIDWVTGNAEELPFKDNSYDAVTIAFGIRNVTRLEKAVREAHRVLRPGGRYLVLEFSSTTVPLIRDLYDWYSFNVIPKMGKALAGDEDSYKYLVESIRKFPRPKVFAALMTAAGFSRVTTDQLAGGIVTLYSGWKV